MAAHTAAKISAIAFAFLLLLPCAALAVSVDIPSERLILTDWLSPFRYYQCTGCSPTAKNYQTFTIDAAKITAQNLNTLPSHIYYRMLVYPNGTEKLVDQFYFRGNESTGSAPFTLKPPSTGGTYSPATVTRYYNNRTLNAAAIDVPPGNYRLDVRHIVIPAATVANYIKTNGDDTKMTKNTVVTGYSAKTLLIFARDGYSSNYGSSYSDRNYYPQSVCNGPVWNEQATSYQNAPYGTVTYHVEQYCYSIYPYGGTGKLSQIAKTEKSYSFTVEPEPIAPPEPPIGINPPQRPIQLPGTVITESPFATGTGDQKTKPADGDNAVMVLAGIGGVAAIGASYSLAKPTTKPKFTVVKDELTSYTRDFAAELEESITASVTRLKTALKETEKWANAQIDKAKKAQEKEDAKRQQGQRSGGIPLILKDGKYYRNMGVDSKGERVLGSYWSDAEVNPLGMGWKFSDGTVTQNPVWVEPVIEKEEGAEEPSVGDNNSNEFYDAAAGVCWRWPWCAKKEEDKNKTGAQGTSTANGGGRNAKESGTTSNPNGAKLTLGNGANVLNAVPDVIGQFMYNGFKWLRGSSGGLAAAGREAESAEAAAKSSDALGQSKRWGAHGGLLNIALMPVVYSETRDEALANGSDDDLANGIAGVSTLTSPLLSVIIGAGIGAAVGAAAGAAVGAAAGGVGAIPGAIAGAATGAAAGVFLGAVYDPLITATQLVGYGLGNFVPEFSHVANEIDGLHSDNIIKSFITRDEMEDATRVYGHSVFTPVAQAVGGAASTVAGWLGF